MTQSSIPQNAPDFSKRYWLFLWPEYEASGGLGDFQGSFDTLEGAITTYTFSYDHGEIFDVEQRKSIKYFNIRKGWIDA